MAAGRGSDTSPRITTPSSASTDAAPHSAAPSSGPTDSTAKTTVTKESGTSFYRNANFVRRTGPDGAMPANLVLKELPLKPFDGDIRSYPEFRDNFLSLIESQAHLGPQQKLQHLMNYLKGAPLKMAEGFGFSDDSYFEVIELLEATYGDKTVIQNLLLQDLVDMQKPSGKLEDLSTFHANARQLFQRLRRNGQNMSENVVVQQILLGKLPSTVLEKVLEKTEPGQGVSPFVILDQLLAHINAMKRKQTAGLALISATPRGATNNHPRSNSRTRSPGPPHGNGGNNNRPPYNNGAYAAEAEHTYAASRQPVRDVCAFCGKGHWTSRCTKYTTRAMRLNRMRTLNLCFICLDRSHWVGVCPRRSVGCKYCSQGPHHPSICGHLTGTPRRDPATTRSPAGGFKPVPAGGTGAQQQAPAGGAPTPAGGVRPQRAARSPTPAGGVRAKQSSSAGEASRLNPDNSVAGKGPARGPSPAGGHSSAGELATKTTSAPSAQISRNGNSTTNRKKQPKSKKKKGTNSPRRNGTFCQAAAASDESTTTKSNQACGDAGLLPGHQALLQTDRCSNLNENVTRTGPWNCPVGPDGLPALDEDWFMRDVEEVSLPESSGHGSHANPDDFEDLDDQEWYPEDDGYAVSESAPPDTQAVLLECIKVTAVNPVTGVSREATAFFDSGSSMTFSSTELAADLGLPQNGRRKFHVNTFGETKAKLIDGFSTSLILRSPQGQEVHLDLTASDHGVKSVRTALITRDELPLLQHNACTLISTREQPDILIGQDMVRLFKRRYGPDLPNGFYVVNTVLGPLVGGAGRVINDESKDVHVAATPGDSDTCCQPPQMIVLDIMDRSTPRPNRPSPNVPSTRKPADAASTSSVEPANKPAPTSAYSADQVPPNGPDESISGYLSGLVEKSDAELLGDFSYLENAGMGTYEMKPDDQTAADMLQSLHTREPDGRFNVPLLFRTANGEPPSNAELPANVALGKGRAISTRNTLAKDPKRLADYHEIVLNYKALGFIGEAPRVTPYTKHCLSHHPVFKETSTTTATRPVFDASAKLPGRTCLNDWVYRGPVHLPMVPAILLRSRLPTIIIVSDIGKAFLQISVKESHRDCLRWFWFKDPFAPPTDDNLIEYRFNRVPFGLKSSPYLLAGVIKMHLESVGTPLALEMLNNCYVDNVLLMADTVKEALDKYRGSKAIFAQIQMVLREYASNNAVFNTSIEQSDRADLEKLRELGIRWDVTADYWDIPLRPKPPATPAPSAGTDEPITTMATSETPPSSTGGLKAMPSKKPKRKRNKKTDDSRLTKRTMLRFVAQIFDPMGLAQAATLLAKLVIQEVWKIENDWDDEVSEELAKLWYEAIKDFDQTTIRIPRRISKGKISTVEIHVFTDGSSQAYGFTAYLRVKDIDGVYRTNLVYARARVKPIKDAERYTIPRMELLGVLVGARAIKFLQTEISVPVTATYLWSDSTIVLHQVADNEKIKDVWVENRLQEVRQVRDAYNVRFRHVPTEENPADIVSRGIAASELQNCSKWWFGAPFLSLEATFWPSGPSSLVESTHSVQSTTSDLGTYGSTSFAALYVEQFTPEEQIPKRKLRSRKKPNPLDTITKPLPTTSVSAYATAALGSVAHSATIPPLPSEPILPAERAQRYPQWSRQVRITYYVLRFAAAYLRRIREQLRQRRLGQRKKVSFMPTFTPALGFDLAEHFKSSRPNLRDLSLTELTMLRKTQLRHPPSSTDRRNLGIFEHQGLLYVKGRLGNMKMRSTALTPLYLPKEAEETALIIMDYHRNNCHSGTQDTLANVRMRYWFTSGRRTVRKAIYRHCFPCRREVLHPYASPPWPQLPTTRVTQARPFFCTGLDFFGPCQIRAPHPDGGYELKKCYVAIFVCMTYRCVHLELCSDLSTEQFLHALRRFGSRREYPARILSDNGQSFLTARQVINQIRESHAPARPIQRRNPIRKAVISRISSSRFTSAKGAPAHSAGNPNANNSPPPTPSTLTPEEETLVDFCQRKKIDWQTITELSPWRGGVYERLIGLIKHCLRRSIGRSKPTDVEFTSLLAEAERTANSRPLSYIADSDTDFYLVRPLDILHPLLRDEVPQNPLDPPAEENCDPDDTDFVAPGENRLHAKIIQGLKKSRHGADTFWTEFRDGYLADLRNRGVNRKKNQFGEPTIEIGDLVLIKELDVPRCDWRLALVLDLLPDHDGLIRTARVRFSRTHQEHTRALEHLYPIGNIPRVPARCDTSVRADVYSISFLSETNVDMSSTSPAAEPDHAGDEVLTTTETDQSLAATSAPTHSVGTTAPTTDQPLVPITIGTSIIALNRQIAEMQTRTDNMYNAIISGLQKLGAATSAEEQQAAIAEMERTTSDLLAAGPRADPTDQEAKTEDSGCPESNATHSVAELSSVKAVAETNDDHDATEPSKQHAAAEQTDAPSDTTSSEVELNTRPAAKEPPKMDSPATDKTKDESTLPTDPAPPVARPKLPLNYNYVFRGAFRKNTNATPRQPYQVQADSSASTPAQEEPQAEPSPAAPAHSAGKEVSVPPTTDTEPQEELAQTTGMPEAASQHTEAVGIQPAPAHTAGSPESQVTQAAIPPAAPFNDPDLVPAQLLLDPRALPQYLTLQQIKRRISQLSTTERRNGQTIQKFEDHALATHPMREPQDVGFGFNTEIVRTTEGRPTNHIWDPVTTCDGCGENPSRFHQSLFVFRIIIRSTWRKYDVIANSRELLSLLDHILALHVKCFGQMILLTYAIRLQGNHVRMASILQFIYDMLTTVDFEWKIPRLLNRYYPLITVGLGRKVNPLPDQEDFRKAAAYWLCYCHKAFADFVEHLSGWPVFNPDWLQGKELEAFLRSAIRENIVDMANVVIQDLRDRVYTQYILRRIRAQETDDRSYRWIRLWEAKPDVEPNDYLNVQRLTASTIVFCEDDIYLSQLVKLKRADVEFIRIESANRAEVLGSIRRCLPGPKTAHAVFWFGRLYINNGNMDYGNLIGEICYHYTSNFGRVRQYVILPGYNRVHRENWTYQALCLFLQKDLIVPHAQVVLHPYDVRLWHRDQVILDRGEELPTWQNPNQDADGAFYKEGALEARKHNMREHHKIDLWTWYQVDHVGERPPAENTNLYQRHRFSTIAPPVPHPGAGTSRQEPPAAPATVASTSSFPNTFAPTAAQTDPNAAIPPAAPANTPGPTTTANILGPNPPINVVNIFGEQALAEIIGQLAQLTAAQVSANIEAKLDQVGLELRQPNTSAEHRQPELEDEW
ncbi:Pao retrotransposon peptidase family protein-like protein [Aphelenchoides avenae]|nr:Pao retrotransposon peptidase family protein-like protein [Aphelenchus avenae]